MWGLPMQLIVGLGIVGGLALLAMLIFMINRNAHQRAVEAIRLEQALQSSSSLEHTTRDLMGRVAQLAEDQAKAQAALAKTLEERLDKVSLRMGESLEKSATTTAQSIGELTTRLTVIDEAQKNMTELSGQVVGLQDILANKQARGAFGEIQLNDLVRGILPPSAYEFQAKLSNEKRVDCLIKLPNPPGPIAVDSKFPLESYHALRNAASDAEKLAAERAFANDISKHVKDIADRYIVPGETADSAIMFLPSEAVYAELHANFPSVVEKSFRAKVWIVSPTTLMATLNTVRAILKDARIREQAHVIQEEVAKMMEDVGRLGDRVGKLKSHFNQAEEDVRQIGVSTEKLTRRGERIGELEFEEKEAAVEKLNPVRLEVDNG
jgi:DNA recombination protein RmuC